MPDNDLRLLALDGGGVRGLSSLMILQQLMATIDPENTQKPCEYFDMIGGTSTGGLIAIMLGRLKMTIEDCIEAYMSLADEVFEQQRHRVTIRGGIQGRFDTTALERAVKRIVVRQGLAEDTLLKDHPDANCKVFVCATSKQTSDIVCLTSYPSPRGDVHLVNSVKIWEACRATSAATSFFDPIAIGPYEEEFVDGALGANNPVYAVWSQAQDLWGTEKCKYLVSVGTGVPSLKAFRDDIFHISDTLIALATETERTAEQFRRDKSSLDDEGRYYRFNVVRGLEDIGLEESKKKRDIAAATGRYVRSQDVFKQMQACASRLSERDYFGCHRTPFGLLGVEGDEVKLQKLLQSRSTDVNMKDGEEKTALHHAARAGNEAMVRTLVRNEAKIDSEDSEGRTALHYAAAEGRATVVKELLRRGAQFKSDNDGKTPLHCAVGNDHIEVVIRLLLSKESYSQSKAAKAAVSALQGTNEAVAWWIKYEPWAMDSNGDTMLHWAASKGQITVMQVLLEDGNDVDAKNSHMQTALHSATNAGHEAPARLLLDYGADIEAKQKFQTLQLEPLFCAIAQGHDEMARLLIERGASTVSTDNGITALHTAVAKRGKRSPRLVRFLIQSGVNVNAQNKNSATALAFAVENGDVEMARLLLVNGADVKIRSKNGQTVLHTAAGVGNEELVQLLLQETDVDVHARANTGHPALIVAAFKGHEAIVQLLLRQKGTDVNAKTNDGTTALHLSAQKGHIDVVRLLIEKGANVKAQLPGSGATVLHCAAHGGNVSIIKLLIQRGASIRKKNAKGGRPVDVARRGGHEEAMRLLKCWP